MTAGRLADERGIIASFFIKVFLVLAIFGIAAADGASIFFAKLRTSEAANVAALSCASAYRRNRDVNGATERAVQAARDKSPGVTVVAVTPVRQTGECTVSTRDHAPTIAVERIGFLKKYADVTSTHTAEPPPA